MRSIKMLGLAAIAAVAAMAFLGASSASAAVLCKVKPNASDECLPSTEIYPKETAIKGETSSAVLSTSVGEEKCASTVSGKTTAATAEGKIETLTFTSCSGICTGGVKEGKASGLPYNVVGTSKGDGSGNGTLKVTGSLGATLLTCPFNQTCIYGTSEVVLDFDASATAPLVLAIKEPLTRQAGSGALCPEKGEWTATYKITNPTSAFLATK